MDDRLSTALRRLDDAESQLRLLKTEWLDTLDRLERIAGRLAKRAERDGRSVLAAETPAAPDQAPPPVSRALADVLRRRARHSPPGKA